MNRKLYKELWMIRFQKMLKLEKDSLELYQSLIKDCEKMQKLNHHKQAIHTHLEKIYEDEQKHARLCEELIAILNRQPD
jgi:hypothetical protein